ncbi:MAG TPA: EamA family transporter [Actinomycetota bacterium]|nr:EamA family transporter [Actinomycetota bacterium]
MAVVLGLLAAISYGSADFLGGLATKRNPAIRTALISQLFGFGAYLIALPFLPDGRFTGEAWLWGGLAGLTGGLGLAFLYRGLAHGRMSVVAPLTAVIAAVLPVGFGLLTGERPSALQLLGIALAIPAIALVSSVPHASANPTTTVTTIRSRAASLGVWDALVSGAAIGLFFITLARPGEETGVYPLVAARIASVSMFFGLVIATRTGFRLAPGTAWIVAVSGVIDVTANLLYLLGTREGLVSVVAVLTSLYPGATVALARVVVKERLSVHQLVGLGFALAGVASMAAG